MPQYVRLQHSGYATHSDILHIITHTQTHAAIEDFTEMREEVVLSPGQSLVTVAVLLGQDDIFPGDNKVFEVYLGPAHDAFVSPTAFANVTIIDNDPDLPG